MFHALLLNQTQKYIATLAGDQFFVEAASADFCIVLASSARALARLVQALEIVAPICTKVSKLSFDSCPLASATRLASCSSVSLCRICVVRSLSASSLNRFNTSSLFIAIPNGEKQVRHLYDSQATELFNSYLFNSHLFNSHFATSFCAPAPKRSIGSA